MTQALYRKWRPRTWEQVVGQEHIIRTLRNAVAHGKVAHAYLFAGPRGTGKTTTARLLAKAVNCLHEDPAARPCDACAHCQAVNAGRFLDLIEIDAASNTSVEDVRDLRDKIHFAPSRGRYKVYIIDEVHMLSTAAFNALLKTLEEPPPHAIFVLATTEVHKIPATVLSRCQRYEFRRIPVADIVAYLHRIVEAEGLAVEDAALTLIARQATGSLRDAISLLDQLASGEGPLTLARAREVLGAATEQAVLDLMDALLAQDGAAALQHLHRVLDAGADPRQFARQVVDYLRQVLLVQVGNADQVDLPDSVRPRAAAHAQALSRRQVLRWLQLYNRAASEARAMWHPSLPLEMATAEALVEMEEIALPKGDEGAMGAPLPQRPASPRTAPTDVESGKAPGTASRLREAAPPARSGSGVDLRAVQARWEEVLQRVRQQAPELAGLLAEARPIEVTGEVVVLGVTSPFRKQRLEEAQRQVAVETALQAVLGSPLRVRVRSLGQQALEEDLEPGSLARFTVELGGKVVQRQPLRKRRTP